MNLTFTKRNLKQGGGITPPLVDAIRLNIGRNNVD